MLVQWAASVMRPQTCTNESNSQNCHTLLILFYAESKNVASIWVLVLCCLKICAGIRPLL